MTAACERDDVVGSEVVPRSADQAPRLRRDHGLSTTLVVGAVAALGCRAALGITLGLAVAAA